MYWTGLKTYYALRRNLRLPLKILKARQFKALRELVEYAYENVFIESCTMKPGFRRKISRQPMTSGASRKRARRSFNRLVWKRSSKVA